MRTEDPPGGTILIIPLLMLPADANQLPAAVPGVVAVKLKDVEMMAL